MEELKLLVESIANLPDLAIWVIAMYFFFKLAIVGSIFGVIRLFIIKVYSYFNGKTEAQRSQEQDAYELALMEKDRPVVNEYKLGELSLSSDEEVSGKIVELFSLIKGDSSNWSKIHSSDIAKAIKALKEKEDVQQKAERQEAL